MSGYFAWNDALAARFFHTDAAGTLVYFYVTDNIIAEVGQKIDQEHKDFLNAVRAGPPGATRLGHCQRALQVAEGWRDRQFEYPPYAAYLALFVLAGGHEGDFAPQAYYPRLWSLLGDDRNNTLPSFDLMLELWDDLEQWSVHDRNGELGVFEARIVGGKIHIGLPLAQTILTEAERDALPHVFTDAELDPGRIATSRELRRALVFHGRAYLQRRTMRALEQDADKFQDAILDAAAEVFSGWDGSVTTLVGNRASGGVFAGLRLCLSVDRVAGAVQTSVRVLARREYPEDSLKITGVTTEALECGEYYNGWSTPIRFGDSSCEYEPDRDMWISGIEGTDNGAGWRLRLEPANVRVFVDGKASMLPGLIEVLELPSDAPFYIAFNDNVADTIGEWLESDCEGWVSLHVATGLPSGWTFGTVNRAFSDRGIINVRPGLGHVDRLSMSLVGGVRASRGNRYFSFAPPRLVIHGASARHQVRAAGRVVKPITDSSVTYRLPDDLPTDSRVGLEVVDNDEVVCRSSLYLVSGITWRFEDLPLALNLFGDPTEDGVICGAVSTAPQFDAFPQDLLRTPGLGKPHGRVFFVGRRRGEISEWPNMPSPTWQAAWAVPFRRKGRAIFCGPSLEDAGPLAERVGDASQRELWHDLLWRRRKRITPPRSRAQKLLWNRYMDAARDR